MIYSVQFFWRRFHGDQDIEFFVCLAPKIANDNQNVVWQTSNLLEDDCQQTDINNLIMITGMIPILPSSFDGQVTEL